MKKHLLILILALAALSTTAQDTAFDDLPAGTLTTLTGNVTEYIGNNHYLIETESGEVQLDGGSVARHLPLALTVGDEVTVEGVVDDDIVRELDVLSLTYADGTTRSTLRAETDIPDVEIISFADAAETALQVYPNAAVEDVDLEVDDNGRLIWDVELSNGIAISVNAQTGLRLIIAPYRPAADTAGFVPRTGVEYSADQLREAARTIYPETLITTAESSIENGLRYLTVTLGNDMVLTFAAGTGELLDVQPLSDTFDAEYDERYWRDPDFSIGAPRTLSTAVPPITVPPTAPPAAPQQEQQPPNAPPPGPTDVPPPAPTAGFPTPSFPLPTSFPPPATTEEA
ncbi:MAG: hypothetical protein OHK0046_03490 [Anaerolineae bacterium]